MKFFVINFFVLLFLTTGVNASTNSNKNNQFITKDILVESLNLETFDNFLTSIDLFETLKSNFFKVPNENDINKIKSQFLFNNGFNTLDLLLRFKMVSAEQPEYLFEIYQVALNKTKNLNYIKDEENILTSDELLINYFAEELINIFGLKEEHVNQANLIGNSNDITTCMDGEDCPPHSPGAEYVKMLSLAGIAYGATLSDYGPMYAGTTKTYNTSLATTWSARQEYRNVAEDRDLDDDFPNYFDPSYYIEIASGKDLSNPYDQIGANDAYAYGLSGLGVKINILDSSYCPDHIDMSGKVIDTFGTVTIATASNAHGCHVMGLAAGKYNGNIDVNSNYSGRAAHLEGVLKYSTMGVGYNASFHYANFAGADTWSINFGYQGCSGDNDTDCWGPQHWELASEDAKAKGAKVSSHSWGWSPDGAISVADLITYANTNSISNYEALVAHQAIKTNTSSYDVGFGSGSNAMDWTVGQWQEYVAAIDSFQETGVWLNAMSNDNNSNYSIAWGGAVNRTDLASGMPEFFPELQEAWINVANVASLNDGTRALVSAPCAITAAYCLSHDGYAVTSSQFTSGGSSLYTRMTGTSMATPQVAGAIAILWESFPDNTPELITKRLLLTADNSWLKDNKCFEDSDGNNSFNSTTDSYTSSCGGITGTLTYNGISHDYNDTYGHGNPDLYAALQPIGKKDLVDSKDRAYPIVGSVLLASTVFGNTMSFVDEQAYYRDQLDGGFKFNVSNLVGVHQSRDTLNQRLFSNGDHIWSGTFNDQGLNFATSVQNDLDQNQLSDDHKFYISFNAGDQSVFVGQKYSIEQMLGLQNGNTTASILNRSTGNNSVLSLTEASANGQVIGSEIDLNNKLSLSVAAYNGDHEVTDLNEKGFLANFKYRIQNNSASFFFGQNIESDSILRSSGSGAFGAFTGRTYHAGISFDKKIASNIYMSGLFDYGVVTDASADGLFLSDMSNLETFEFNLGFVIPNIFSNQDFAAFKISQPLRTERGSSKLNLPGLRDANGKVTMTSKNIDLEPSGRELNLEAGYEKVINSKSSYKFGTQLSIAPNHSDNNNEHMIYGTYSIAF